MAWREKKSLTCPECRRSEPIIWVLGRPLKRGGNGKGYIRAHAPGGWLVERGDTDQTVICPNCGTQVKRRALAPV